MAFLGASTCSAVILIYLCAHLVTYHPCPWISSGDMGKHGKAWEVLWGSRWNWSWLGESWQVVSQNWWHQCLLYHIGCVIFFLCFVAFVLQPLALDPNFKVAYAESKWDTTCYKAALSELEEVVRFLFTLLSYSNCNQFDRYHQKVVKQGKSPLITERDKPEPGM